MSELRRAPHGRTCRAPASITSSLTFPVRQWVLSLPHPAVPPGVGPRPVPAGEQPSSSAPSSAVLRDQGRAVGLEQPRGGAVAIIQRFGGALNLNVHIHALVLDGVFAARRGRRRQRFIRRAADDAGRGGGPGHRGAADPAAARVGRAPGASDEAAPRTARSIRWAEEAPALAGLAAASVQGLVALGRHPGTRVRRLGHAREAVERPRRLPGPVERVGPACGSRRAGGAARAARAGLPLCAPAAGHARAARGDGRRPGAAGPQAAVGRRDDARGASIRSSSLDVSPCSCRGRASTSILY